ncbi:hypothetical protein [Pseudomonas laurylsulfatiphila]|uniref:hypothetical protein n=1 Tax=Pseudomonas laurylsulfatiphila TaxID=2011015 RepID=UPI003D231A7B
MSIRIEGGHSWKTNSAWRIEMAIVSVVVHPKGATHVQRLAGSTYYMKQGEHKGEPSWMFHGGRLGWLPDSVPVTQAPYKAVPLH